MAALPEGCGRGARERGQISLVSVGGGVSLVGSRAGSRDGDWSLSSAPFPVRDLLLLGGRVSLDGIGVTVSGSARLRMATVRRAGSAASSSARVDDVDGSDGGVPEDLPWAPLSMEIRGNASLGEAWEPKPFFLGTWLAEVLPRPPWHSSEPSARAPRSGPSGRPTVARERGRSPMEPGGDGELETDPLHPESVRELAGDGNPGGPAPGWGQGSGGFLAGGVRAEGVVGLGAEDPVGEDRGQEGSDDVVAFDEVGVTLGENSRVKGEVVLAGSAALGVRGVGALGSCPGEIGGPGGWLVERARDRVVLDAGTKRSPSSCQDSREGGRGDTPCRLGFRFASVAGVERLVGELVPPRTPWS